MILLFWQIWGVTLELAGHSQISETLAAISSAKERFLAKRARVKENDGVDPDAEEAEPEPVANGAKANGAVKEATFQLLNAEDFPGRASSPCPFAQGCCAVPPLALYWPANTQLFLNISLPKG